MLYEIFLPKHFWIETVNTTCYVKKNNINQIKFECWCFILNTKNQLGKLDSKVDKGIFLGYLDNSKAGVFNFRNFEESIHVNFNDELMFDKRLSNLEDDFAYMHINQASYAFVLEIEPKAIKETLQDDDWMIVMEEELQYSRLSPPKMY
ncbi:hypothetical protein CR513_08417, partial [Mucuna pruriens]